MSESHSRSTWEKISRIYQKALRNLELVWLIDPFNNDVIHGKALKYVSFVLNKFSQIATIEPKLTTYWHKRGEQVRNEYTTHYLYSSTISHEVRLLPQCFFDVIIKKVYKQQAYMEVYLGEGLHTSGIHPGVRNR